MRINSIYRSVIGQSIYNRYNSSHNLNVGLHPRAGQPAADGYNTRSASQSKMGIMQDRPVSQRWIQYTTGQSIYNEIHIQYRASQSNSNGQQLQLATQFGTQCRPARVAHLTWAIVKSGGWSEIGPSH